tara:strand:- start:569 stop:1216 length:648 start_codon:yes stop_codon:yes gene_type:complete
MATLTPTASAMHEQYVKTYNKWLQQNYPDQYGNWLNKGPKRRFIGKWGSRFGALGFLYEGLKEVFDTGNIPADINEREGHRAGVIEQFVIDTTPQIIYKDGLAVGFEAPKGSDVDLSRYMPYQAAKVYDEPQIPETNGETLEWIDPMDEWWPINDEHVYTKDAIREANDTGFISKTANAAKNMYDTAKYYTPPEIRQKLAETTAFVSGGAYKLKD